MSVRRVCVGVAAGLLLAGCQGVDLSKLVDFQIQTAAQATPAEARKVVGMIYAQAPASEISALPYANIDFLHAAEGIKARLATLQPWFQEGVIGNTTGGFVAVRDASRAGGLKTLLRAENNDRARLYGAAAEGVGPGEDDNDWAPFEQSSFGKAWIDLSPSGWWFRDGSGAWRQKP